MSFFFLILYWIDVNRFFLGIDILNGRKIKIIVVFDMFIW